MQTLHKMNLIKNVFVQRKDIPTEMNMKIHT